MNILKCTSYPPQNQQTKHANEVHMFICLLSCFSPKEYPDIDDLLPVIPSSTKIDVERIKTDIPKYYPFLRPSSADDWNKFCISDFDALLSEEITTEVTQELQTVYRTLVRGSYQSATAADGANQPTRVEFTEDRRGEKEVNVT